MGKKKKGKKKDNKGGKGSQSSQLQESKLVGLADGERRKALWHYSCGELSEAHFHLTQAIALLGHDRTLLSSMFTLRAAVALTMKNFEEAAYDCQCAVILDERNICAQLRRAAALCCLRKMSEAAVCVKSAIQLNNPNSDRQLLMKLEQRCLKITGSAKKSKPKSGEIVQSLLEEAGFADLEAVVDDSAAVPAWFGTALQAGLNVSDDNGNGSRGETSSIWGGLPPLVPPEKYYTKQLTTANVPAGSDDGSKDNAQRAAKEKELGNEAFSAGKYLDALEHYGGAINLNPSDAIYFSNRAAAHLKLGRLHDAISDSTTSIRLRPTIKAYARRATAWAAMREWALAGQDFLEALRFEPKNPDCWAQLLRCLGKKEVQCRELAEAQPDNPAAQRAWQQAQDELRQISTDGPTQSLAAAGLTAVSVPANGKQ